MAENAQKTRDRKAEYDRKRKRIWLTVTHEQHQQIKRAAKQAGMKPAAYVRDAVFAHMEQRYLVPADQAERLEKLIAVMRNIGTSLNRVARFAATLQKKKRWFGKKGFDWKEAEQAVYRLEDEVRAFVETPPQAAKEREP